MIGVERVQTIKRSIYGYISILTQYMNEIIDIACFQDFIYVFIIYQHSILVNKIKNHKMLHL